MRLQIMYQLEMASDLFATYQRLEMDGVDICHIATEALEEAIDRNAAALYMVQALYGGNRPSNFQEVIDRAASHDARIETGDLISRVQRGHRLEGH